MYQRNYGGAIWTNHALERLSQRQLPQDMALQALKQPDNSRPGTNPGTTEFNKQIGQYAVQTIAAKNEHGEWVIVSCWVNPPLPGSIDIKKKQEWQAYKKAGFWGKLWIEFKRQLGFYTK